MRRLIACNVDGILTDEPELLFQVLRSGTADRPGAPSADGCPAERRRRLAAIDRQLHSRGSAFAQ